MLECIYPGEKLTVEAERSASMLPSSAAICGYLMGITVLYMAARSQHSIQCFKMQLHLSYWLHLEGLDILAGSHC